MSVDLHQILLRVTSEVRKADKARQNSEISSKFQTPREAMLMLHAEWHLLMEKLRAESCRPCDDGNTAAAFIRIAAVCSKAAADLSNQLSIKETYEKLDRYKEPLYGYLAIAKGTEDIVDKQARLKDKAAVCD